MLFNDIFKTYGPIKIVGHAPCAWAKLHGRYFEMFYTDVINIMHFTCPTATIRLCAPASISSAGEKRLDMLFNDDFKTCGAIQIVGHGPCAWAKLPGRYFEPFHVIVVNLMRFTCSTATG